MGSLSVSQKVNIVELHAHVRNIMEASSTQPETISSVISSSIHFLEQSCSAVFGYQPVVSTRQDMSNSFQLTPTVFDSAYLLNLLTQEEIHIHKSIMATLINVVQANRKQNCWNFFFCPGVFPNDVDTTCISIMGLYSKNILTLETCQEMAVEMLKCMKWYDDGLFDTYFPACYQSSPICPKDSKRRVDVGVVCNVLCLMGRLGLHDTPELKSSFHLIENVLDSMSGRSESCDNVRYYINQDLILYLISRIVISSPVGKSILGSKLEDVCRNRIMGSGSDRICAMDAVSISCRLLTALSIDLHEDKDILPFVVSHTKDLMRLQEPDNSFPPVGIYEWPGLDRHYLGSCAISTGFAVVALAAFKKTNLLHLLS